MSLSFLFQWTQRACADTRGCVALKHTVNPCIYDNIGLESDFDDIPAGTNISWPRAGSWNATTRLFTFNDTALMATKDIYPFASIEIPENQFNCSDTGGWYNGSSYHDTNGATTGRKRRAIRYPVPEYPERIGEELTSRTAAMPGDTMCNMIGACGDMHKPFRRLLFGNGDKHAVYANGTGFQFPTPHSGSYAQTPGNYFAEWMDTNHPNYFNETSFNETELNWMKWGAWSYLYGETDGENHYNTLKHVGGLYVGISNIMSM